jgi:DNA-binding MarR family transcriptional regulator
MSHDPLELAARFRQALMPLVRQLRTNVEPGMTPSLMSALATVRREGPIALGDLANAEKVTAPMATKLSTKLEELGLVERAGCEHDRRVVHLTITDEGHQVLDRAATRRNAFLAERFAELSDAEQQAIADAVAVIERISR